MINTNNSGKKEVKVINFIDYIKEQKRKEIYQSILNRYSKK